MGRNEILSIVLCNLNRHDERLEEIRIELLMGRLQRRNGLHTVAVNPILELPYVGNISNGLPLNRHVAPRENVMIPTSSSCPSNNGIESYLLKVSYIVLSFFPWVSEFCYNFYF